MDTEVFTQDACSRFVALSFLVTLYYSVHGDLTTDWKTRSIPKQ